MMLYLHKTILNVTYVAVHRIIIRYYFCNKKFFSKKFFVSKEPAQFSIQCC